MLFCETVSPVKYLVLFCGNCANAKHGLTEDNNA
jgi:hypothetical protein